MLHEHIIDATGFIALSLNVRAAMGSSDRTLRKTSGWASAVWAVNNLLIGAQAAAALSVLSVARQAGAGALDDHQRRTKAMVFAALVTATLLIGALTWNGIATAFPLAGSLTATYAMLYMRNVSLRLAMVAVNALWMVNALVVDSGWQLAAAAVAGAAAAIGAWRASPRPAHGMRYCSSTRRSLRATRSLCDSFCRRSPCDTSSSRVWGTPCVTR